MKKQSRAAKTEQIRRERRQAVQEAWKAENTERITVRLNRRTDADILERLEGVESKQGELKRLVRLGIGADQRGGDAE